MRYERFAALLGSSLFFAAIGDKVAPIYHGAVVGAILGVLFIAALWIIGDRR